MSSVCSLAVFLASPQWLTLVTPSWRLMTRKACSPLVRMASTIPALLWSRSVFQPSGHDTLLMVPCAIAQSFSPCSSMQ